MSLVSIASRMPRVLAGPASDLVRAARPGLDALDQLATSDVARALQRTSSSDVYALRAAGRFDTQPRLMNSALRLAGEFGGLGTRGTFLKEDASIAAVRQLTDKAAGTAIATAGFRTALAGVGLASSAVWLSH